MITNTFHSSTRRHAITSSASLAKVQRHNSRGYFSFRFDPSQICDLVGCASTIAADVENAINLLFSPYIEAYNDQQRLKGKKTIEGTAFQYFEQHKGLHIAIEAILQLGDDVFWPKVRSDTVRYIGEKEYVFTSFPQYVKDLMNHIFTRQIRAYEEIYQTHGDVILQRINCAYEKAQIVVCETERDWPYCMELFMMKGEDRTRVLLEMDFEEQVKYIAYQDARKVIKEVESRRLRERIKNGEMHVLVVSAVSHFDEHSPHSHVVSLCYADNFTSGLSSRVAKSVVLNVWALEVIQERLHEIAEEEMKKHPEVFGDEELKEKMPGRNINYTTEQIKRKKQAEQEKKCVEAQEKLEAINAELRRGIEQLVAINTQKRLANEEYEELLKKQKQAEEKLADINQGLQLIKSEEEYLLFSTKIDEMVGKICQAVDGLEDTAKIFKSKEAKGFILDMNEFLDWAFDELKGLSGYVCKYEVTTEMQEKKRRFPALQEKINHAAKQVYVNEFPRPRQEEKNR